MVAETCFKISHGTLYDSGAYFPLDISKMKFVAIKWKQRTSCVLFFFTTFPAIVYFSSLYCNELQFIREVKDKVLKTYLKIFWISVLFDIVELTRREIFFFKNMKYENLQIKIK